MMVSLEFSKLMVSERKEGARKTSKRSVGGVFYISFVVPQLSDVQPGRLNPRG